MFSEFGRRSPTCTLVRVDAPKMSSVHDPLLAVEFSMGKDRRRFIVVAVFDLCLITILWLICTVIKGSDWQSIFSKEVNIFDPQFLKVSLFDIVISAILRVLVLVVCYAFLFVDHWFPVALTTFATTAYLVVKVLFFFLHNPSGLPQYLVIISSLVIAWFELWLVPFRVLPRERRHLIAPLETPTGITIARDTPLRIGDHARFTTDDEFRSAVSSDSEDEKRLRTSSGRVFSKTEYVEAVEKAEVAARADMDDVSNWRILSKGNPEVRICEQKRIYYLRAEIQCSPQTLFKTVWMDNTLWNKQVSEFRVILHIDPSTEVCYTTTVPAMRGYIAARDFLDVRRSYSYPEKELFEGFLTSVDSSIVRANVDKKLVRGFNGPSMMRFSKSVVDPSSTVYEWVMNSDIKGSLPRSLVDRGMNSFLLDYAKSLRNFVSDSSVAYL